MYTQEELEKLSVSDLYDKKNWGPGEWQDEPDVLEFEYKGYPCALHRNRRGFWCGYVFIPMDSPHAKEDYFDIDLDVHGDITFGEKATLRGKEYYSLGFDCAHSGDFIPSAKFLEALYPQEIKDKFKKLDDEMLKLMKEPLSFGRPVDTYKNMAFARSQCEYLVDQMEKYG